MPAIVLRLLTGLAMGLLVACSSAPDKDSARPSEETERSSALPDFSAQVDIDVEWRRQLGQGANSVYTRLLVAVDGSRVYAAEPDGTLYALELNSGSSIWQVNLDEDISAGVTYSNDQLFVATKDGVLHCLSADTGDEVWSAVLPSEAVATAGVDDDRVFVHTIDGRVTAFERADGQQVWSYENAMPVLTVRGTGVPLVMDQLVITGFATGKLLALDKALGIPRWDKRLASPDGRSELERLVDIDGSPIWEDGRIYAASYHGNVAALALNGQTMWEEEGSSYTSPTLALGSLYLTLDDGSIQAYDQLNGAIQWRQQALQQRNLGQVTVVGRYLLVADEEGYIHALRQVDGELVGRRLIRPKPLHVSYPNQSEATRWRLLRGRNFGVRSVMINTGQGILVYTNAGELLLLTLDTDDDADR